MEMMLIAFIIAAVIVIGVLAAKVMINEKQLRSFKDQLHEIRTENQNRLITVDNFGKGYTDLANELQQYVEDEKKLIEKAEEDRQSVNMMVAGISHDFRTPLTSATGYLQMAQQSGGITGQNAEYVDTALRKMQYLRELSDEFFTLSLVDSPQKEEVKAVSLKRLFEDITLGQYDWIEKRGLEFSADITDDSCDIRAVEVDMIRLLENLYSNARKYTKSRLKVSMQRSDAAGTELTISNDTDIIRSEDIDDIFKPFHRTASGEAEGSGLGLYIARKIVQKYGGSITAALNDNVFTIRILL